MRDAKDAAAGAAEASHVPLLQPGAVVAIHSRYTSRFMRMNGDNLANVYMDGSGQTSAAELPADWTWELFTVVDAGNGEIALWSNWFSRFVRMHDTDEGKMDGTDIKKKDALPDEWTWERFTEVDIGLGEIGLYSKIHGRFVRLLDDRSYFDSSPKVEMDKMPGADEWPAERFTVVEVQSPQETAIPYEKQLKPGVTYGIYSPHNSRFLKVSRDNSIGGSPEMTLDSFPGDWQAEQFTVVDAGDGQIALWNPYYERFLRFNGDTSKCDGSDHKGVDELPGGWTWERFTEVDAGFGQFALHSPHFNKFIRLRSPNEGNYADAFPDEVAAADIKPPSDWAWERFQLVRAEYQVPATYTPKLTPGLVVAFHNKAHWRYMRLRDNADMDSSDSKGPDELPGDWTWERFHVVDAGNGEVALWNQQHHRFMRMWDNGKMDGSDWKGKDELPGDWTWERFVEVDGGYGQIGLWSKVHNRFVSMGDNQDIWGTGHKGKDEFPPPSEWTWERFTVVQG